MPRYTPGDGAVWTGLVGSQQGRIAGHKRCLVPLLKPHATMVKLCVLAHSTVPYVVDMYIYKGKCRLQGGRKYKCVGCFTANKITNYRAD